VVQADPRKGLVVAAGEGAVRLLEVRPEGGRTMAGAAYAAGRRGLLGEVWDGGAGGG
jgi:methionyl-tRNA formyltransferase